MLEYPEKRLTFNKLSEYSQQSTALIRVIAFIALLMVL